MGPLRLSRQSPICTANSFAKLFAILLAGFVGHSAVADELGSEDAITLHRDTKLRFATPEQAETAFRRLDRFTESLSVFDLQSRLDRSDPTLDGFFEFSVEQIVPWTAEQKEKLTVIIESLEQRLLPLDLPLPKTVFLVQTTGKIEGKAAYCRGNAIMLPSRFMDVPQARLEPLLAHELFHVLSSHDPQLRYELYKIIGFKGCPPIELTGDLADRKITNPDAPQLDCVLRIDVDGELVPVTPFLWAKSEFVPGEGKVFFDYLQFRLLVLEPKGGGYQPRLRDGEPWFVSPNRPDFYWNIGTNTGYIIHPEEVLADNFKALVMKTPDLPTPRITQEMLRILE
jgi:hypothetical protein